VNLATQTSKAADAALADEPYIHVRLSESELRIDGANECHIGRRVAANQSSVDQGIFANWNWNGERLLVQNDRFGFFPLFYAKTANAICISPSIQRILALGVEPDLDEAALAVFLRLGSFLAEDTPFSKIRALPPGARLEWENGNLTLTTSGVCISKPVAIARTDAIAEYSTLFKAAIARLAPPSNDFVVPLSGGRDSRHILLELFRGKFEPRTCLTQSLMRPAMDPEVRVARQLCTAMNLEHVVTEPDPARLSAELRKNKLTQFCALEHAWVLPVADTATRGWEFVYDGIAGDVLSAGLFLNEIRLAQFREREFERLAQDILGRDGYLQTFLPERERGRFGRDVAVRRLVEELARHVDAPNPVGSFFFWNRTRRAIAASAFNLFGRRARVVTPYLDHQLFDFLASIPAELLVDHQFHTDTIVSAYPEFADIPFARKEDVKTDIPSARRFAFELFRFALSPMNNTFVRRRSIAIRAGRATIDRSYTPAIYDLGPVVVYLKQLDRLRGM
jgi:asparagine synthase (glutamine-hydrolysing)